MINNALIEAMVSPGLKRKPEFVWGAEANDPKTIIGHLAEGKAALPHLSGEETRLSEEIGLAFIVGNTFDRSMKSCWPTSELQRVATIAMQMGYEVAALQDYLPHTSQYLTSYMETVRDAEVSNPQMRSIQTMCMTAVLAVNLQANEKHESDLFKLAAEILDGYTQEPAHQSKVDQIMAMAVNGEGNASTTEDFAKIAKSLFMEQGKTFEPESDVESEQQQSSEAGQADAQPESSPKPDSDQADGKGDGESAEGSDQSQSASDQSQSVSDQSQAAADDCGEGEQSQDAQAQAAGGAKQAQQANQQQKAESSSQEGAQPADVSGEQSGAEEGGQQPEISPQNASNEMEAETQQACSVESQPDADVDHLEDAMALVCGDGAGGIKDERYEAGPARDLTDTFINGRLVTAIVKTFQNTRVKDTGYRTSGGKLDVRRAMRIPQGETKVFKTRQVTQGMEMAMTVLVDRSQSMASYLQDVCKTALSFAIGLSRITNTKTRIAAFPAMGPGSSTMVLEFGENQKQARSRLERLTARGSTPLAQAIIAECQVLLQRRERRKVITVLTDGLPDDGQQVIAAIRWAAKQGVEVVGIGFAEAKSIQHWIEHSTYVRSIDELPKAIEKIFEEKILKAA